MVHWKTLSELTNHEYSSKFKGHSLLTKVSFNTVDTNCITVELLTWGLVVVWLGLKATISGLYGNSVYLYVYSGCFPLLTVSLTVDDLEDRKYF